MGNWGTALHHAASGGHTDLCVYLLSKGARHGVDSKDRNDCTPPVWAISSGHTGICPLLISSGANAHLMDTLGRTMFHYAAVNGAVDCVISSSTTECVTSMCTIGMEGRPCTLLPCMAGCLHVGICWRWGGTLTPCAGTKARWRIGQSFGVSRGPNASPCRCCLYLMAPSLPLPRSRALPPNRMPSCERLLVVPGTDVVQRSSCFAHTRTMRIEMQ